MVFTYNFSFNVCGMRRSFTELGKVSSGFGTFSSRRFELWFTNKKVLLLFYVKFPESIVCLLFTGEFMHGYKLIMM